MKVSLLLLLSFFNFSSPFSKMEGKGNILYISEHDKEINSYRILIAQVGLQANPNKYRTASPFLNSYWFYLICVLFFMSLSYLITQTRMRKLKQDKELLESKVKERTSQLLQEKRLVENAHDQILQQKELIRLKNEELMRKNEDILNSLAYAQTIQQSLLPHEENISSRFSDFFIFYKPRDIVSGDFYWFSEKNGLFYFAVADCTGHGVPGALMSMIGVSLLNDIVNDKGIRQPAEILNQLTTAIRKSLNQDQQVKAKTEDGMDIAMCAIDLKKNQLQFAGAKRPLILVHNGEMTEVKGDRFSIGGTPISSRKSFKNHFVTLEKDTMIFLGTDGFADQFGGRDNKKMMNARFKKILTSISSYSCDKQKDILEAELQKWMGNEKQVDDILVMGVRT